MPVALFFSVSVQFALSWHLLGVSDVHRVVEMLFWLNIVFIHAFSRGERNWHTSFLVSSSGWDLMSPDLASDLLSSRTLWCTLPFSGESMKSQKENVGDMNISLNNILDKIRNGQREEWGWGPLVMREGHWLPASLPSRDSPTVNLAKSRAKRTVYKLCVPSSQQIEGGENPPHSFSPSASQLH